MSATTICFVRHGHVHNPQRIVYARLPRFRLSEEGLEQAHLAGAALQARYNGRIAAIFSSPMLRARQTARILLGAAPQATFHTSRWINETHTPFQGASLDQMAARDWEIFRDVLPPYEQPADILRRMLRFIQSVRRQYAGQVITAVSHGDPIAFVILWAKNLPISAENRVAIPELGFGDSYPAQGSLSILTFQSNSPEEKPAFAYLNPAKQGST